MIPQSSLPFVKAIRPTVLAFTLLFLTDACQKKSQTPDLVSLKEAYRQAVRTASGDQMPISRDLWAILPNSDQLVWDGSGRILVVTWTAWDGYDQKIGETLSYNEPIWVTAAPQVRKFCENYQAEDLELRLRQLLGLPPDDPKTRFVELWVHPGDLYRPCPDPAISDHECERSFPASQWFVLDDAFTAWFNDWKAISYGENGYPWTRLGYTFDWANPSAPFGMSEFIIQPGKPYEVASVSLTHAYCGRP